MWLGIFTNSVLVTLNASHGRKGPDAINATTSSDDFEHVITVGTGIGNESSWFAWKWTARRGEAQGSTQQSQENKKNKKSAGLSEIRDQHDFTVRRQSSEQNSQIEWLSQVNHITLDSATESALRKRTTH